MITDDWRGLYQEGWGDEIVPEAFAHPAKYARGLIRRIYAYLFERGYLHTGDRVLDPFGGVALGGLDAMLYGCHWIGVELEARFVALGNQNIDRWNDRYHTLPGWGSAVLLQGDSRELAKVIAGAGAVVTSPPYEGSNVSQQRGDCGGSYRKDGAGGNGNRVSETWRYNADNADNLGNAADFWHAARQIVDECYKVLAPGAVAVWVVKRFVRDKQIVPFPDQWRQMCEAAGFETVEWIRAWVVEDKGTQLDLWGNGHSKRVERKSFFRRLYESKYPENAIDWEDVLIMWRVKQ